MPQPWERDWSGKTGGAPWERQWDVTKPEPSKERTFGEAATDVYAGLKGGVGSLLQLPTQLAGVVGGAYEKPGEETGLSAIGKELREEAEAMKSPGLKAREASRAAKIAEAEKKGQLDAFFTAFSETIRDPGLLTNFLAEQAPQLIPSLGAARLVAPLAGTSAAVRAAVGTGAVQQGADIAAGTYEQVYKELTKQGVSETEAAGQALGLARLNGVGAVGLSILAQRLPGARSLEEAFAGKKGDLGRILGGVKGALGESVSEVAEETPARFLQNLAMAQVAPETSLTAGLGETAGMAAVGGAGLGGATGLLQRQARPEEAPPATNIPSQFAATPESEMEPSVATLPRALPAPELETEGAGEPPLALPAPPVGVAPPVEQGVSPEAVASEDALRARAEAPPITEAEFVQGEPLPRPPELAEMEQDMEALGKEVKRLERGEPGKSLWSAIKGNLTPSDLSELGDKKFRSLRAPKGMRGVSIADLTASGQLNDWLPEQYHGSPDQLEFGRLEGDELTKAKDAEEYIKNQLRQGNYLTHATNMRLQQIGVELSNIEEAYREYADAETFNTLVQEAIDEQRGLYESVAGAPAETEAGITEPPARVLEQIPEEQVEEEYFPDQEEVKQKSQSGKTNQIPYDTVSQSAEGQPLRRSSGSSEIINYAGRMIVMRNVNGVMVPFYLSTGGGGKVDVPVGKWYPFFGIGADGWINKTTGKEMVNYYGSEALKQAAQELDATIGDIRNDSSIPRVPGKGRHIDFINRGLAPAESERPDTLARVRENINRIVDAVEIKGSLSEQSGKLEEREAFVINKDKEHERIEKELTGKTMLEAAQWAVDNAPNQFAKVFAQKVLNRLNGMAKRGIKLEFNVYGGQRRRKDMYRARGRTDFDFGKAGEQKLVSISISLNGAAALDNQNGYPPGTRYITVLHELLHAATVGQTRILKSSDPIVKELRDLFNQVVSHFNTEARAGRLTPFMEKIFAQEINALESPDELLAWGIADEDMQRFLSDIKVGEKTIMDKLVELIRKILNVTKPYLTALDQLVRTTESILDEDVDVVGDKIIAKQYSFGVKPGRGEAIQGSLFEQSGVGKKISEAGKKVVEKIESVGKKPGITPDQGFAHVDPEFLEKLGPIFAPEGKTFADKMDTYKDRTFQRLAQGIADQYRTIKDYSPLAYIKARMSKTVDGALEGLTFYGQVKLTDGALDIKPDTKGLIETLKPIGNEVNSFLIWRAMSRDSSIVEKSKRTQEEIADIENRIEQLYNSKSVANKAFEKELNRLIKDQTLSDKEKREDISKFKKETDKYKKEVDQQVAVERATIARLKETIKLPSISPEVVEQRDKLASGKIGNESRLEVYNRVSRELNKLNQSVLDVALAKGQIDKRSYETFLQDVYYIPFYKMVEEGQVADIRTASGLANQYFSKALKGGEKPFGDLMENLLRNWNHILSASMKNDAAVETLKGATEAGAAYPNLKAQYDWRDGKVYKGEAMLAAQEIDGVQYKAGELRPGIFSSDGKGLVKVMMNGYPAYYEVIDPLLVESIMSIGYMGPKSKFLDMARDFKNILQYGVTLSPAFKVRNLVRDSVQSAAVSGIGLNIAKNVTDGLAASKKGNPDYISALAGGAIFNFGSSMEGDQARLVKRLIQNGVSGENILNTESKIKNGLKKMYDAYQELGNRSEAANRMALYKQLRAKGLSHLEASFQARDLLDFSMQGAWPAVRLVTQVIPFLNARVQGLYKLGRDGIIPTSRVLYNSVTGKESDLTDKQKAQQFSIVTGAVVLASLMLYMAFKDDDEYKKREQWDRDNFWWFRLPGMDSAVRIPKPFEIGAFGTLAERIAEQMFDEGAEGRVLEQSMKRMLTDTFAINPIPQMIKPLVDLYANKDSFTGAPIETAGMERLSKAERVATNTSPLAKVLSQVANVFLPEATEVSPVQTDYAIKAYLGWMGATITATSHYAVMPFSKSAYPDHNWQDTISLGFVKSLPANQSGYVTSFYENMKIVEQAYADMRHYAELGQSDKVQQILEEKGDKIQLAKFYDKTSKDMSKIRQAIQVIKNDETMDGAQKKEEIDRLKQLIGDLAKQAEDVRKSLRK